MNVLTRSRLALEPNALALRQIGDWLASATHLIPDEATATSVRARAELATHEACMNVVDHANLAAGEVIELRLLLTTRRLTVQVVDQGDVFHLAGVRIPPVDVPQERGYGVKIIRSLVTALTHRRIGSTNVLELTIDLGELP